VVTVNGIFGQACRPDLFEMTDLVALVDLLRTVYEIPTPMATPLQGEEGHSSVMDFVHPRTVRGVCGIIGSLREPVVMV